MKKKPNMLYEALPHIFEKARKLRKTTTKEEQVLWKHLKKRRLEGYRFRRQHPIWEFVADLLPYCQIDN